MMNACSKCGQLTLLFDDGTAGPCPACARKKPPKKQSLPTPKGNAHPNAIKLLSEPFLWSVSDDDSPFGNDTGRLLFESFKTWRHASPLLPPTEFLAELLKRISLEDSGWDEVEPAAVERAMKWEMIDALARNDVAVAMAFSQLVVDGRVDDVVRTRAACALQRELQDPVVKARGWLNPEERRRRVTLMLDVLGSAPGR